MKETKATEPPEPLVSCTLCLGTGWEDVVEHTEYGGEAYVVKIPCYCDAGWKRSEENVAVS